MIAIRRPCFALLNFVVLYPDESHPPPIYIRQVPPIDNGLTGHPVVLR